MTFTLKRGWYADIKLCDEIMRDSALYDAYFRDTISVRDYILEYFPDNGRGYLYFAVADNGDLAGLAVIHHKGFIKEYDYLALLGVKKEYRGTGAGRFLLAEFENICRQHGCRKASLLVSDFNDARHFYEKHGYYQCGIVPNALVSGIHEYIMMKDLVA